MSTLLAAGHVLVGARVAPALAGMAKVQSSFAATAAKGRATGLLLSKAVSLPVAAGFAFAIHAAAQFESSLNDMQAVTKATDATMKNVSATAKQLGADTKLPGTSAKDAADAMVQLAKGGMTANQAMGAARGTLLLAAAAGIDNAQAATIQADALNAFSLKADQAGRVADLLAGAANASTGEITDMASALQQSAAVAAMAGVPIEDVVTAISSMANAGIKGSDAGTSLKTMLMRLQAPIGTGAKAIAEYGIRLRDAGGELKSLPALAQEFTSRLGGLTKAQRDQALAAIFGTDSIRAANVLLMKGAGAHEKMKEKVTQQGEAQRIAAAKMKGFNGALEAFKSTAETAAITVGTILLPMVTGLVRWITSMAQKFEALPGPVQKGIVVLLGVAAVVGPLLLLVSAMIPAIAALGVVFGLLLSPVGLAIIATAALAAGLIYAYKNSETFRNVVNAAFEGVKAVVGPVIDFITAKVAAMSAWFRLHWAEISATASAAMARISTVVNAGMVAVRAIWNATWPVMSAVVKAAWNVISTVVTSNMRILGNIIRTIGALIRGDWSAVWAGLRATASSMLTGTIAVIRAMLSGLASVVLALARQVGRNIVNGIRAGLAGLANLYSTMWTGISSAISSAASAALSGAASIGRAIVNGAVSGMGGLASALRSKAQSAISSALSNLNPFSPVEHGAKIYIADPIIKGATKLTGLGTKLKLALTKEVRDAVMSARQNAGNLASSLGSSITAGIDAMTGRRLGALGNSPEAQQLRAIQAEQKATATARERYRLENAINAAQDDKERAGAIQDLADWELEQQRALLEDKLAVSEAAINAEADARKTAAERGLADLTDSFNRQLISEAQFQAGLQQIIADSGVNYASLGDLLGTNFANGFSDALQGLRDQIALLAGWAGISLPGAATEDPFATQMDQWRNRRKTLADNLAEARKDAAQKSGPGGTGITAAERARIAKAQAALTDWDQRKPIRAALGGILRGGSSRDSIPMLAKPGEAVLSHQGVDQLMQMAMGRGGGGGGRETHVHFHVTGNTILGDDRSVARRLAEIVQPELNRRVTLAA